MDTPPDNPDSPEPRKGGQYNALAEASALGFMFPLAIGLGFLWGWGLDKWFGTWPWLAAIFSGFGVIAAFLNLFRLAGKS